MLSAFSIRTYALQSFCYLKSTKNGHRLSSTWIIWESDMENKIRRACYCYLTWTWVLSFIHSKVNLPIPGCDEEKYIVYAEYQTIRNGLSWWLRWLKKKKKIPLQWGRPGFNPLVRKIPCRRAWQPTPVFLPGESLWGTWQATVHGVTQSRTWLSD